MTDSAGIVVRDYRPEDLDDTVRVLTDGFLGFPPVQAIVGTGDGAAERLHRLYSITFDPLSSATHVIVAERQGAIVGVLTYADQPDCFAMSPRQMLSTMRVIGPRIIGATRLMVSAMRIHPGTPHRHLSQVAVDPVAQRQGVGGALMSVYCARCDEAGLPGYLETVDWADARRPSQRKLYERFGFEIAHADPMKGVWTGISMLRPARTG